jgi:hypothetical protein
MDEFDLYVRDFLWHNCRVNNYIFLERDFETERKIELVGKIEYKLRSEGNLILEIIKRMECSSECKDSFVELKKEHDSFDFNFRVFNFNMKTILDIFNIKGFSTIKKSWLSLKGIGYFSYKNRISFDAAIEKLVRELDLQSEQKANQLDLFVLKNYLHGDNVFEFRGKHREVSCIVSAVAIDRKKILLPLVLLNNIFCYFFPYDPKSLSLFNQYALENAPQAVIITDCLEIAHVNQTYFDKMDVKDIVFLSWYGGDEHINDFDWSPLAGRRVYFLFTNHSGNEFEVENLSHYAPSWNKHFQTLFTTATKLRSKLDKISVDFRVIFCELNSDIGYKYLDFANFNSLPFVCRLEDLKANILNRQRLNKIQTFGEFRASFQKPITERKQILAPLFYAHSATLIYGKKDTGKTLFALNLALSLAMGKKPIAGWRCIKEPVKVLYFYRDPRFVQKLKKSLAIIENSVLPNAAFDFKDIAYSDEKGDLLDFILKKAETLDMGGANKIIFIDVPLQGYWDVTKNKNDLVEDLKMQGWAVVIVQDEPENFKLYKEYKVDSGIQIEEVNTGSINRLKQSISIKSKLKLPQSVQRRFSCIFDFSGEYPRCWKERTIKDRSKYLDKRVRGAHGQLVRRLVKTGWTGPQIATLSGLSLSMVKKLKRELGLSKPRNPQSRNNPYI